MGGEKKMSSGSINIKGNTRILTKQLNDLFENNVLSDNPNEVKEFLKENIDVCTVSSSENILESSEDIIVYVSLKEDCGY